MNNTKRILAGLGILLLLSVLVFGVVTWRQQAPESDTAEAAADLYTCPMHPSVISDRPGACPVCGMSLVKKTTGKSNTQNEDVRKHAMILSGDQQAAAGVATVVATVKSMTKVLHATGVIDYPEPNFRHISMRFPGRIERLFLTSVGQMVNKGDRVAEIFSPEAISAQHEYLLALQSMEAAETTGGAFQSNSSDLLAESKAKLLRWGFTNAQLENLEKTRMVSDTITIYSPISGIVLKKNVDPQHYSPVGEDLYDVADISTVWLHLDIYERDVPLLRPGTSVEATGEALPGKVIKGTVTFISPVVDPTTRTVRVRVVLPNPGLDLKIGMFMTARIISRIPESLVLPSTAVISTGNNEIVWVKTSENMFEPRSVEVGIRTHSEVQIVKGISKGEQVVSSGGYLIDSESQLAGPHENVMGSHPTNEQ